MRKRNVFVLFVCIGLISVLFTVLVYHSYFIKSIQTTPMIVSVTERTMGFDVTDELMSFGQISKGRSGTRKVTIGNFDSDPVLIQIKLKGEMAEWIGVSDNLFELAPGKEITVNSILQVPSSVEVGQYTGEFLVYYLRT